MTQFSEYWDKLAQASNPTLIELFEQNEGRVSQFSFDQSGMKFDYSKTHLDAERLSVFKKLAAAQGFAETRNALFAGDIVNPTEGRPAEHSAQRGVGSDESVHLAQMFHGRMRGLIEAIDASALGEIKHIIHIGIGGSALGPKLLIDALARESGRYDVEIVSNVDGAALHEVFKKFDPQKAIVAIASKTFTTTETMLNAKSAIHWLQTNGVGDPYGRLVALTAAPDKALEFGVDETRILPFSEAVGGRYSIWSSIGFPIAMALGWDGFSEMLAGGAEMDEHFQSAPLEQNAPVLAAFSDMHYAVTMGCQTRAVFAYDERLVLLPSYLQQLEMESNGKSVTLDGEDVKYPTAPITWGGVGTDAQHAVFQLLHQGTHLIPVEFIAVIDPEHDLDPAHHQILLTNCFAQGAALMAGKVSEDPARSYSGNRPSSTILMEEVSPRQLGALIAFYEHRTFTNAVLMGINPFDQFGVELGKEIAKSIETEGTEALDASTKALMAAAFEK